MNPTVQIIIPIQIQIIPIRIQILWINYEINHHHYEKKLQSVYRNVFIIQNTVPPNVHGHAHCFVQIYIGKRQTWLNLFANMPCKKLVIVLVI
jgi:hypothetical protein